MYRSAGALLILGWSVAAAAQGQATLTLACKGTTTETSIPETKPVPVSMGIIVNFTARTVQGFGFPGMTDYPVKITGANDVIVAFGGQQEVIFGVSSIEGSIDRVTGDVWASSMLLEPKTSKIISQIVYTLQCRPAQRMF
jgi:hypothetical protein